MMKMIFWNMIRYATRHYLKHLCSQKYEGYQWNKKYKSNSDPLVSAKKKSDF